MCSSLHHRSGLVAAGFSLGQAVALRGACSWCSLSRQRPEDLQDLVTLSQDFTDVRSVSATPASPTAWCIAQALAVVTDALPRSLCRIMAPDRELKDFVARMLVADRVAGHRSAGAGPGWRWMLTSGVCPKGGPPAGSPFVAALALGWSCVSACPHSAVGTRLPAGPAAAAACPPAACLNSQPRPRLLSLPSWMP